MVRLCPWKTSWRGSRGPRLRSRKTKAGSSLIIRQTVPASCAAALRLRCHQKVEVLIFIGDGGHYSRLYAMESLPC